MTPSAATPSLPSATPRRRAADDSGMALITVIGVTFAITLLITAALSYAVRTLPQTRAHEDGNAAMAAAEAGVDDLLFRLNQDRTYWSRPDPDNDALTGWRSLGTDREAAYSYFFDASDIGRTGSLDVVATGRVGERTRTVQVRLRPDGFLEAIYFTDYEASDPYALSTDATTRTYLDQRCAVYHPHRDTRPVSGTSGGCSDIRFAPGDELVGPTRSNDAMLIRPGQLGGRQGPRFLGPVETGWDGRDASGTATGSLWLRDASSTGEPVFAEGVRPLPNGRLAMPETSRSLAEQARDTGCAYQGPTYVRLDDARMHVVSPLTPSPPSGCVGTDLPLPDGEVLFVSNSTASVGSHPLGMPITATQGGRAVGDVTTYSRTAGDVFVHGRLQGQLTIAAENDVVIVGDTVYRQRGVDSSDLLGLIADNNVWIYHPVRRLYNGWGQVTGYSNLASQGRNLPPFDRLPGNRSGMPGSATTWNDPEVDAAILALNRSFGVQNFNLGAGFNCGGCALSVHGAIAQRWRGPVATAAAGSTTVASGYLKDYVYDTRLRFLTRRTSSSRNAHRGSGCGGRSCNDRPRGARPARNPACTGVCRAEPGRHRTAGCGRL